MKVRWENDWPIFNENQKLQLSFESHQEPVLEVVNWRDDFSSDALSLGWYTKSRPGHSLHSNDY